MADNVAITAGAGTNIATDDVAGNHYQKMKLYTSEADSAEGIGDDDRGASRALWVSPKTDLLIPTAPVDSAGLTTATTAYSIGDTLGSGWTIPNAATASGGKGRILAVMVQDCAAVVGGLAIYFFTKAVTFGTDNAAPSLSDADGAAFIGKVLVSPETIGTSKIGAAYSLSLPYALDGGTSLFAYCVTQAAHTFFGAVTDLKIRVSVLRD